MGTSVSLYSHHFQEHRLKVVREVEDALETAYPDYQKIGFGSYLLAGQEVHVLFRRWGDSDTVSAKISDHGAIVRETKKGFQVSRLLQVIEDYINHKKELGKLSRRARVVKILERMGYKVDPYGVITGLSLVENAQVLVTPSGHFELFFKTEDQEEIVDIIERFFLPPEGAGCSYDRWR